MPSPLPLTYLEAGENAGGTPLVILHGLFGSARNWATLARRFGERRHVYALDLRNHGGSPWAADMSYPAMAADVRRFLDDRGFGRATLLGHSMGGKTAMLFALSWPERVESLIAVDIAPVAYDHSFEDYAVAMQTADLGLPRRSDIDESLATAIPNAGLRSFLMQNLVSVQGHFRWRINLDAITANNAAITGFPDVTGASCPCPALFLSGGRSDYVQESHRPLIRALFPKARFEVMDGCAHWPHAEAPEAFAEVIERTLA